MAIDKKQKIAYTSAKNGVIKLRFSKSFLAILFLIWSLPSLADKEAIAKKVDDLFVRWRYADRSVGTDISPWRAGEVDSLLQEMDSLKGELEARLRADRLDEYMIAFQDVLMLFAAADPGRLEALNEMLAPKLSAPIPPTIKSCVLIYVDCEYRLGPLPGGGTRLAYSRDFLNKLKSRGELMVLSKNPDELLFAFSAKAMAEQLQASSSYVEKMLASAKGDEQLKPQEREALARKVLMGFVKDSPQISEAFNTDRSWITPQWSSGFLEVLLPDEYYAPDSEGARDFAAVFSRSVEERLKNAATEFPLKILHTDWELNNVDGEKRKRFLCQIFVESVREGRNWALLSLAESEGKKKSLRAFLEKTAPRPSCDFLKGLEVTEAESENPFHAFVQKLETIVHEQNDPEAFLAQPVEVASAIEYYRAKKLQDIQDSEAGFTYWLTLQTKLPSYRDLKKSFHQKYREQEGLIKEQSPRRFLQELSTWAKETALRMDEMAEFLRLNEDDRVELLNRELPGVADSEEDREHLQEMALKVQKQRYPILETEDLMEKLGKDTWKNREIVWLALEETRRKIQDSIDTVNSWEKVEDMELALKHSQYLSQQLNDNAMVSGLFLQKYEDLLMDSDAKLILKEFFHKYVGIGFAMLILVDFGPMILKHIFRWAHGASYLKAMQGGIPATVRNFFIASAFSMIGINLAYDTWDIFWQEVPAHRDARQLFQSSASSETEVFSYPEYLQMEENIQARKTAYYWQAAIDGTLLSFLAAVRISWLRQKVYTAAMNRAQKHFRKTNDKIERAFKNLGVESEYVTWNKDTLKDIYSLRMRELKKTPRAFAESNATLSEIKKVDESYHFLLKKYARFQKSWERHGVEYRFDFERLGLPPGEWNWHAIDDAYAKFQLAWKEKRISEKEFGLAQESFERLNNFLMGKLYNLSRHPTLKELFLESVGRDRIGNFFEVYGRRLNEDGLHLDYDVVVLKSDNGSTRELIIPRLSRRMGEW